MQPAPPRLPGEGGTGRGGVLTEREMLGMFLCVGGPARSAHTLISGSSDYQVALLCGEYRQKVYTTLELWQKLCVSPD